MNTSNNFTEKTITETVDVLVTHKDLEKGAVLRRTVDTRSTEINEFLGELITTLNNKLESDVVKNKVTNLLKTGKHFPVEDVKIVVHNIDEAYDNILYLDRIEMDDSFDEPPMLYGTVNGKKVSLLNFRNYYITSGSIIYSSSEYLQPKPSKEVYDDLDKVIRQIMWSHYDEYVEVIKDDLDLIQKFKEETIKFYGVR